MARARTPWLTETEQQAWRSFIRMQVRLNAHLSQRMQSHSGLSMADYEVLVHLSEAPEGRLRVFELGRGVEWEKSRLSHHLRRMAGRGLVERTECPSDGRGAFVTLTAQGRRAIEAAAPLHVADVRHAVIDALSPEQLAELGAISEVIDASIESKPCGESA